MLRWLLIPIVLSCASPNVGSANPSSRGPTSNEEAELLWSDGKAALENGDYLSASHKLQRLIDRYPGHPGYLDAHLALARSFYELDKPKEALAPLKYYVTGVNRAGRTEEDLRARLWLGRVYLKLRRFQEAYLISRETEKLADSQALQAEQGLTLLLRTHALIGLGQIQRAEKSAASAKTLVSSNRNGKSYSAPVALRSESAWLELKLKLLACSRLLSARSPLTEAQVRDQARRRGLCLSESLPLFKNTLDSGDDAWSQRALAEIKDAYHEFREACSRVPDPPLSEKKKKTAMQLKRYRAELTAVTLQDCKTSTVSAADLIKGWKTGANPAKSAQLDSALAALAGDIPETPQAPPSTRNHQ